MDQDQTTETTAAFTEEAVDNGPSQFDLDAQAAIDAIAAEFVPDAEGGEGEAPQVDAADESAPPSPSETPAGETEANKESEDERGFERLVAREVAVREKEQAIAARESRFQELEAAAAKASQYEARIAELESAYQQIGTNPTAALRAGGHDPDQVVRLYLAEKMAAEGKPIPEKLQAAIERAQDQAERRAFREEQQNFQRQQAAAAFVAQVENGANQYVRGEISKDAPTLAIVAKADPARAYREIMDEISRDAAARAGKDPNASVLPYEEAAKRVETRWSELRRLFGTESAPAASTGGTTPPAAAKPAPKAAPKQGASKPTPKPLTTGKALSYDELMLEAVKAGEAEYARAEQARLAQLKR